MATRGRLCNPGVVVQVFKKLIGTAAQISLETAVAMSELVADVAQAYTIATSRESGLEAAVASSHLKTKARQC